MLLAPIISLERAGYSPRETLANLQAAAQSEELAVSAIVYTELLFGIYGANSPDRETARRRFIFEVFDAFDVEPFTRQTAETAARIRGEQMRAGNTLPFADSLIAAVALSLRRPLLTTNMRDSSASPV